MDSLTELYNQQIVPLDEELEKQATEMWKQAEEEDAAGRIMARGFADELDKLAAPQYGKIQGADGPRGNTRMAEAPPPTKNINFTKSQGSKITGNRANAVAGRAAARKKGGDAVKSMFGGTSLGTTPPATAKTPPPAKPVPVKTAPPVRVATNQ
jgi:hypothetical protein